mgnify:FL=1
MPIIRVAFYPVYVLGMILIISTWACSNNANETSELKHFPVDSMEGIISRSETQIDPDISSDGNGSLRIDAKEPMTVRLYETGDMDIEDSRLIYRAKLRTQDVEGQVYLEMLCDFSGKGEFFTRNLKTPLSGTNDWSSQQTPFFLKKGENPSNIKLNLIIDGTGRVWLDEIKLVKVSLK